MTINKIVYISLKNSLFAVTKIGSLIELVFFIEKLFFFIQYIYYKGV